MSRPSKYDQRALAEIEAWKNPESTWLSKVAAAVGKPLDAAGDAVFDNRVGAAVGKAVKGIISLLNDGASWSVRTEAILKEYRQSGHPNVRSIADVRSLDLEEADRVVGYLAAKYKSLAAAEGAAAGMAGAPGIAVDIPALIALNLRAVNEYAVYYGFDPSIEAERHFALDVLLLGSSPTDAAKQATMAELHRIALGVARRKTWKELERNMIVRGVQEVAKALGVRLTKAKLGQVIPVIGAAVGGGYNAWYTSNTTEAAFYLYRERFLLEKYGEAFVEGR